MKVDKDSNPDAQTFRRSLLDLRTRMGYVREILRQGASVSSGPVLGASERRPDCVSFRDAGLGPLHLHHHTFPEFVGTQRYISRPVSARHYLSSSSSRASFAFTIPSNITFPFTDNVSIHHHPYPPMVFAASRNESLCHRAAPASGR